ncbi:MAG: hypothetical protein MJ237_02420 [bacterium]|nr:hypothetical protein [bacterium]
MNNKKSAVKKNISSLQVLKTFKLLMTGNYNMHELVGLLNDNDMGLCFNTGAISKYINTCRYCGINIIKNNNKYIIAGLPFGVEFTDTDLDTLLTLQLASYQILSGKDMKIFKQFLGLLDKYTNRDIVKIDKSTTDLTRTVFEKAISDKRKIRIRFRTSPPIECIPIDLVLNNGKIFFNVYYNNKEKLISSSNVFYVEVLNDKFLPMNMDNTVIFKIKGELIKRYHLREHENIIEYNIPEFITIANRGEKKELLLTRLLKYDTLCEIISPKSYREEMKQIINDTLSNYGE